MKKITNDEFERKYKVIFNKLIKKQGFVEEVKEIRKKLGMPEDGFNDEPSFSFFLLKQFSEIHKQAISFLAFADAQASKNKMFLTEETYEKLFKEFVKDNKKKNKKDKEFSMIAAMMHISSEINKHHNLFVNNFIFEINKNLKPLKNSVTQLMQKYFSVDLFEPLVVFHYIEKYLFLGEKGVDTYIKSKLSCHNCKYFGVEHFSPTRLDMEGADEGPFSKNYIFNKSSVEKLSRYFDSVFVIVRPFATKELVLQYIDENWEDLKEHLLEKNTFYKQYDVSPSVIRESDEERNKIIYELYKLPKKELLKIYEGQKNFMLSGIYKEQIISGILEEKHQIQIKPEAIRKVAMRYKKSITIQQMPKDIRDI